MRYDLLLHKSPQTRPVYLGQAESRVKALEWAR